jgi:hypothetical protein
MADAASGRGKRAWHGTLVLTRFVNNGPASVLRSLLMLVTNDVFVELYLERNQVYIWLLEASKRHPCERDETHITATVDEPKNSLKRDSRSPR